MASDEAARLHLYEQARSAFDDAAASTLMSAFDRDPDRFATKDDIVRLDSAVARLDASVVRLDARIDILEANLRGEIKAANADLLRTLFFAMVASNATLVGLVFAAVRLG